MLEDARAGDAAFLGHMADQEHADALLLGIAHQPRRALSHLRDRSRRRCQFRQPQGLDGIDDQDPGLFLDRRGQDALDIGFGLAAQAADLHLQAPRPLCDLSQRLLAADIDHLGPALQTGVHLQHQRGLADTRITADQNHRTRHQTAAQHPVQFSQSGIHPDFLLGGHTGQIRYLASAGGTGISTAARARTGTGRDFLDQTVPGAAISALPGPLGRHRAAFGTDITRFRAGCAHAGSNLIGYQPQRIARRPGQERPRVAIALAAAIAKTPDRRHVEVKSRSQSTQREAKAIHQGSSEQGVIPAKAGIHASAST